MSNLYKTYFNWSSGKDASLALYHLQKNPAYEVSKLITTVNAFHNRVSMHGLRREMLEKQVAEIDLPLSTIELPEQPDMETYEQAMNKTVQLLKSEEYTHCAFGDIFLEDLRKYREDQLAQVNIKSIYPIWKRDTKELIKEFISLGFKAIIICIKSELLDESFVGREIDEFFLNDLPDNVDPCGENGEFHTFCYDGPIFKNPIAFKKGEKVFREYKAPSNDDSEEIKKSMGFWFLDLIPI